MKTPFLLAAASLFTVGVANTTIDSRVADAVMRGDTAAVRSLVALRVDVNVAQGDGMTALHWAASKGDVTTLRLLLGAGAKVEATTRNGSYTPIHLAARNGNAAIVRALITARANASAMTATGAFPIHFAAGIGDTATI